MVRCGFNGLRCGVAGRGPAESPTAGRAACPATLLSAYTTLFSICLAKGTFNAGLVWFGIDAVNCPFYLTGTAVRTAKACVHSVNTQSALSAPGVGRCCSPVIRAGFTLPVGRARAGPSRSIGPLPGGKIRFLRFSAAFTFRSWLVPQLPHLQVRSRLSFAFTASQVLQVLLLGYQTGARVTAVCLQRPL